MGYKRSVFLKAKTYDMHTVKTTLIIGKVSIWKSTMEI